MSRWGWDHISARLPLSTMNATHPGTKNSLVTLALRPLIGGVKSQVPVVVWVISSTSPSFHRPSPPPTDPSHATSSPMQYPLIGRRTPSPYSRSFTRCLPWSPRTASLARCLDYPPYIPTHAPLQWMPFGHSVCVCLVCAPCSCTRWCSFAFLLSICTRHISPFEVIPCSRNHPLWCSMPTGDGTYP